MALFLCNRRAGAAGADLGLRRDRQHAPVTTTRRRHRTPAVPSAIALLAMMAADRAFAQDMEPRAYSNAPVGLNVLVVGYGHSDGGLSTNSVSPLQDAQLTVKTPFIAYARAFDIAGRSAKIDVVLPAGRLTGSARTGGNLVTRDVSGFVDPTVRASINLFGAPALSLPDFAAYRQDPIVGVSLQATVPLGQYDPTRLVNLGANRWVFRPEVGISKAIGRL